MVDARSEPLDKLGINFAEDPKPGLESLEIVKSNSVFIRSIPHHPEKTPNVIEEEAEGLSSWGVGATPDGIYPLAPFLQERGISLFTFCSRPILPLSSGQAPDG